MTSDDWTYLIMLLPAPTGIRVRAAVNEAIAVEERAAGGRLLPDTLIFLSYTGIGIPEKRNKQAMDVGSRTDHDQVRKAAVALASQRLGYPVPTADEIKGIKNALQGDCLALRTWSSALWTSEFELKEIGGEGTGIYHYSAPYLPTVGLPYELNNGAEVLGIAVDTDRNLNMLIRGTTANPRLADSLCGALDLPELVDFNRNSFPLRRCADEKRG
ncbi:hypothetical protein C8F04DRAFT_1090940 [Mycena alexandri]|uniref:Uncharacterized protein n=1 Tax=Mycena alexandri TaxID=1745969 RepID=A0AAD6X3U2_9AGAR|nr:hypothetical protein C8F04DRAFT_1090940 [Mycena alexandri]